MASQNPKCPIRCMCVADFGPSLSMFKKASYIEFYYKIMYMCTVAEKKFVISCSWLNSWLQWIGQRQLQDETRNISVLGFGTLYIIGLQYVTLVSITGITTLLPSWHYNSPNSLRAKFFRENINTYLHFMSFLHTKKTQVVDVPLRVRQGHAYST